jgi:hypothetical protein
VFQVQQATPEIQKYSVATPRTQPVYSKPPRASLSRRFAGWLVRISLVRRERETDAPTLRNFDT